MILQLAYRMSAIILVVNSVGVEWSYAGPESTGHGLVDSELAEPEHMESGLVEPAVEDGLPLRHVDLEDGGKIDIPSPLAATTALFGQEGYELVVVPQLVSELHSADQVTLRAFPLSPGWDVDLELSRLKLVDERSEFVLGTAGGDVPFEPVSVLMFRGHVAGAPGSRAYLALYGERAYGHVSIPGEVSFSIDVAPSPLSGIPVPMIRNRASMPARLERPTVKRVPSFDSSNVPAGNAPGDKTALVASGGDRSGPILNMALDGDFGFYQSMGSDSAEAAAYMISLLGASAAVYVDQIDTTLRLSFLRVWTVEDPLGESLSDFSDHWVLNLQDVERDHAHKFTDSLPSGDGIAWIFDNEPLFCRNPWFAFAITEIDVPFVDEVVTFSQELGHNCGSVHTHCYDPPLDICFSGEPGCYTGTTVQVVGTIMSYCNAAAPKFHDGVVDYMRPAMRIPNYVSCLGWARTPGYVSSVGGPFCNDDIGTSECPWRTVEDGVHGLFPGGVLNISSGLYAGPVTIDSPGVYRTAGSGNAIIGLD